MGQGRVGKHRKHPGGNTKKVKEYIKQAIFLSLRIFLSLNLFPLLGRGNAGGQHHHRINFDKYHPGYFGKVGMRYFHLQRNKYHRPIVNLDTIWNLVGEEVRKKYAAAKPGDAVPVIDVTQHNYFKVQPATTIYCLVFFPPFFRLSVCAFFPLFFFLLLSFALF